MCGTGVSGWTFQFTESDNFAPRSATKPRRPPPARQRRPSSARDDPARVPAAGHAAWRWRSPAPAGSRVSSLSRLRSLTTWGCCQMNALLDAVFHSLAAMDLRAADSCAASPDSSKRVPYRERKHSIILTEFGSYTIRQGLPPRGQGVRISKSVVHFPRAGRAQD